MLEEQLISIGIITYNSAKYIIEALNSVFNQTYQNIELIISDDGSKDLTVQICREWLKNHGSRFARTNVLVVDKNTGTAGNMNRLFEDCKGKWVKPFAGDDKLLPTAIETFVKFCKNEPNYDIVFSNVICMDDDGKKHKWEFATPLCFFKEMSFQEMYYALLDKNFFPAPSAFITKKCWEELGKYDETIPLLEDWPFWLKAFHNNKQIGCMGSFTAIYRFSDTSVSQGNANKIVKTNFFISCCKAEKFAKSIMQKDGFSGYLNSLVNYYRGNYFILWYILRIVNLLNPYRYRFNKAKHKRDFIVERIKEM